MATYNGDDGNNTLIGGSANDDLNGFGGNDFLQGGDGVDNVIGGSGNDTIGGNAGNDWVRGGTGNDSVSGGGGQDSFAFADFGAANADVLTDFAGSWDNIQLDLSGFTALGSTGRFASGDVRFRAGTAAQDADDRIIYNQATGQLWYDADGNGAGAAQLIATLSNRSAMSATDIFVFQSSTTPPPTPGQMNGTAGNDSITGTEGSDTINGLGGNDTLDGSAGDDRIDGGAGDDSIRGGEGADSMIGGDGSDTLDGDASRHGDWELEVDTMNGGLGDDYYVVDNPSDMVTDAGGVDTIRAVNMSYTLPAGFENLIINNDESEATETGIGNELNNVIGAPGGSGWHVRLFGMGGNDTIYGSPQDDSLLSGGDGDDYIDGNWDYDSIEGGAGNDTLFGGEDDHDDTLTGGAGADTFYFRAQFGVASDRVTDFASGTDSLQFDGRDFPELGASGRFSSGDARFYAAAGATSGHDTDDRLIYDTTGGNLYFDPDGSGSAEALVVASIGSNVLATDIVVVNGTGGASGGTGSDSLVGGSGNDSLSGGGGNDTLIGLGGRDTLDGGTGADSMEGGADSDTYLVDNAGDLTVEANGFSGGQDIVLASISWTLASSVEDLTLVEGAAGALNGTGNAARNTIVGNSLNNVLDGGGGDSDQLEGLGGNDTLTGAQGFAYLYGGDGDDRLVGPSGSFNGGAGNDRIEGGSDVEGNDGNDTIISGAGNAEITGGLGADTFVFQQAPASANWDRYTDFTGGSDTLQFDGSVFTGLGASGRFAAGDERFYSAAGATAAHDATDRLIYNTSTGELFYDADGTGAQAAVNIAELRDWRFQAPAANLQATDIVVTNGSAPPPPPPSGTNGTEGNDSMFGTAGNDTLNGLGGNDYIQGQAGADRITGGAGNDTIGGNDGADTLEGGLGNDALSGGGGQDFFVFREAGAANTDSVSGFGSAWDALQLDDAGMAALGSAGRMASGDARFWAAAGATAGHDADDRVIYNTTTGQLYYDADGSGAGLAQPIATLTGAVPLTASDITVI